MSKEAIQKDVSEETEAAAEETQEAPQGAAMERLRSIDELAKQAEEHREAELQAENEGEADDDPEYEAKTEDSDQAEEKEQNTEEPEATDKDEPKKRVLKVDGQEKEFDEDKILEAGIRALQKESTADKRLEEATQLLREAQQQTQPSADAEEPESQDATSIAQAIQYGTEEEAAKAVEGLLGQGKTEGLSVDQVKAQVADDLAFNDAIKSFQDEYPDIAGDPTLFRMVGDQEAILRGQGDTRPYKEMYSDLGKQVREWRDNLIKQNTQPTDFDERKERKKQTETIKPAGKTAVKPTEEKPQTRDEILESMRKVRGQGQRI